MAPPKTKNFKKPNPQLSDSARQFSQQHNAARRAAIAAAVIKACDSFGGVALIGTDNRYAVVDTTKYKVTPKS